MVKIVIITTHNNAIVGYLQYLCSTTLPKTVLPNGAVVKIVVSDKCATISLLTNDGEHTKFLKKENISAAFSLPIRFNAPNSIIYLVRHGESEANIGVNHVNPSLTRDGIEDAMRAGNTISSDLPDQPEFILLSSPLTRAVQTLSEIKKILGQEQLTILDLRCIESVRDMGRPIHTRGPNAAAETIIACDPRHPLCLYRHNHICDPAINEEMLENLVAPNRLPPSFDFPGVSTELLLKQLVTDWPRDAALTPLDVLVASHL